jgi:hypothetical protein
MAIKDPVRKFHSKRGVAPNQPDGGEIQDS